MNSANMGGDCSASRPKRNPPLREAVDGLAEVYSNERVADEPCANVGNGLEKCGDNCGSSKCGETWMRWNDFGDSQGPQQSSNILSHVHTRKFACDVGDSFRLNRDFFAEAMQKSVGGKARSTPSFALVGASTALSSILTSTRAFFAMLWCAG